MSTRAMAIGGHADGRYVEFPTGATQAYGWTNPYVPSWPPPSGMPEDSFTILRTVYRLEEFRFGSGEASIFLAVPENWTARQALKHLVAEHEVVE